MVDTSKGTAVTPSRSDNGVTLLHLTRPDRPFPLIRDNRRDTLGRRHNVKVELSGAKEKNSSQTQAVLL